MKTKRLGIMVYEKCTASMVAGVLDILSLANSMNGQPLFDISIVSPSGDPVNSFSLLPLQASKSFRSRDVYDLIYIPGFVGDMYEIINANREVINWLRKQAVENKTILAAACNGNVLLAETGLLDHKKATTHWSLTKEFESRYTHTEVEPEKIIIDQGNLISAAGVTSYFNLGLHLIQRFGSTELSLNCAKVFLVDSGRRLQTPYLMFSPPKSHGDPEIIKVQEIVEQHYAQQITVENLLQDVPLGRRTLLRRFKNATGDTPLEYLQRIRIEKAKRLLEATNKTFSQITSETGYNDVSSFQRLFKSITGLTPREYRNKFLIAMDN